MSITIKKSSIYNHVAGTPWAILPSRLAEFWSHLETCKDNITDIIGLRGQETNAKDFSNGNTVMQGDIAVVKIHGFLEKKSSFMQWLFGGCSMEELATDIRDAVSNVDVKAIILDIDSPGGTVDGTKELADTIYALRGTKPIKAYINGLGASAAYWIASAADEITAYDTASVGSVGVVTYHIDASKMYEAAGIDKTYIYAGRYKVAGNETEPISKDNKAYIQDGVDSLYSIFVNDIARNRNMAVEDVVKTEAKVYVGQEALDVGLVDKVGTFTETLIMAKENSATSAEEHLSVGLAIDIREEDDVLLLDVVSVNENNKEDTLMDLKTLKEKHPNLVEEMKGEFASQSKASTEVAGLTATVDAKASEINDLTAKVDELTAKNKKLVKEAAVLGEKAASALASSIMTDAISDSNIPEKLHSKALATMPSFNDYVSEGEAFEKGSDTAVKFAEAVNAEVSSWEASLPVTAGLGVGAADVKDDNASTEDKDVAYGRDIARTITGVIRSDG